MEFQKNLSKKKKFMCVYLMYLALNFLKKKGIIYID